MKTKLLPLICALFFSLAATISAQTPAADLVLENGVAPHRGLDDVYRRFSEGYRRLDAAAVAGLYTETAAYLSPGSEVEIGREKILENFSRFFGSVKKQNGKIEIAFRILQRQVDRNLAYDVGIYTLTSTGEKGEKRRSSGKFFVVARREKEEVWRFQVDGYNDLPKPANGQSSEVGDPELEKLFDPIFAGRMQNPNIPGAAIPVIRNGKTIFAKGCGVADVEKKTPVAAGREDK